MPRAARWARPVHVPGLSMDPGSYGTRGGRVSAPPLEGDSAARRVRRSVARWAAERAASVPVSAYEEPAYTAPATLAIC